MAHTGRIETALAAWSLAGGFVANFAGFILMGRLGWPLSVALIALGTSGLVGAMLLVASADRNPYKTVPTSGTPTSP
jgi:hypothetical protein